MAIKLYYHIYTSTDVIMNQWLIDEQLKRLIWQKMPDKVECYCTISGYNVFPALDLVNKYRSWMKVLEWEEDDPHGEFEGRTLKYLWRDAQPDDKIFYMHTKGISFLSGYRQWGDDVYRFGARNVKALVSWRLCMETSLIDVWTQRVEELDRYDTIGCYLLHDPFDHYMGNFWWTTGKHVRKLEHPFEFDVLSYPNMHLLECTPERIRYEQWLFTKQGYHLNARLWPFHITPDMREPGISPGANPYEDDFAAIT
ncbi:hypothetical protein EBU71_11570 [bacterium]|nr:hypothetical protein [Candidatus Elulimicrobium humile]